MNRGTMLFAALLGLPGCTAKDPAADTAPPSKGLPTNEQSGSSKDTPPGEVQPSPWQPPAEIDPVPPPVEGGETKDDVDGPG